MRNLRLLGCFAVIGLPALASADLLVSESFDYAAGSVLAGQNGGTGFTSPWNIVTQSNGTLGTINGPEGSTALSFLPNPGSPGVLAVVERNFPTRSAADGLWFSFRVQDTPDNASCQVMLGSLNNVTGAAGVRVGAANRYGLGGTLNSFTNSTTSSNFSATDLVVVQILPVSATTVGLNMYINPGSTIPGAPTQTRNGVSADPSAFATFRLVFVSSSPPIGLPAFDDFRVGTTFDDVIPSVPTPTGSVLMLLSLSTATRRRRQAH